MKDDTSFSMPFEFLTTAFRSLNVDQLLTAREQIDTLIEQIQDETEDRLVSDSEIDYSLLQTLLAEGNWEEADEETADLILEVVDNVIVLAEDVEKFPISDLLTINRLWTKYSNGRFGFSAQRRVFHEVGSNLERFAEAVGWISEGKQLNEDSLNFSYTAPVGHFPFIRLGLTNTAEIWSAEYFTDSEGEDQVVNAAESVEPIEMWRVFLRRLESASATL